jgi:predicted ATPase/DNA-binding XRE family transcriptional regulator
MELQSFGNWLRLKRKALDLTREELAERLGYSAATVRKIEDEERRPSVQIAGRLAEIFNIPQNERESFLRFARGDWKSIPTEIKENIPWQNSNASFRSNLPATTTSLIGREKEIKEVREYLLKEDIRLVTLLGPPGIGKTRLSIEAARTVSPDFRDGVFFAALAPLDDPTRIASAVVQAFGFMEVGNLPADKQLAGGIGEKKMLIVLDNCEHLIEGVALLASFLLSACSHLKILVTSRESVRILGEWLYPVRAFDLPEESSSIDMETASKLPALTLFAERARAVRPDFVLDSENIKMVSVICTQLDGLPLAIELIAARIRFMSPQTLLERLSGQFVLTADGMRAASTRQKTLNNAIGWSYSLLSEEEQRLFAHLSVFSGSFTLEAAQTIFSKTVVEKSISDLITLLLDKSLLQDVPAREPRFTMLVTIQEFARARLRERGVEAEVRNWHLAYFLDLAEKADMELRGHHQLEWSRRLNSDRDNLRAALTWAIETKQTEIALKMVRKLDWFWMSRSEHTEGRQWLQRGLEMPDTPFHPAAHAEMLTQLAHHIFLQIGEHQQRPLIDQALLIARENHDKHNMARALAMLGLDLTDEENHAAAQSAFEESAALYQEVQDGWGLAHAMMCLAYKFSTEADFSNALSLFVQALAASRKTGDRFIENVILRGMAIAYLKQDNLPSALGALRESLILAQQLDTKLEIAATLSRWGSLEQRAGRPARAVSLYWAAKNLFDLVGAWTHRFEFDLDHALAPCRTMLSDAAFAEAVERGHAMTMEQAIAYALEGQE